MAAGVLGALLLTAVAVVLAGDVAFRLRSERTIEQERTELDRYANVPTEVCGAYWINWISSFSKTTEVAEPEIEPLEAQINDDVPLFLVLRRSHNSVAAAQCVDFARN